jgi:integrase
LPRNHKRTRVERGLYKAGDHYYACATPTGSRAAVWKALGPVNLMEARRLRDKFCAQVQGAPALALTNSRRLFGDLAAEWLDEQRVRMDVGEMSPRTYEIYELGLRRHVLPVFAGRQVRAIDPDALVAWIRTLRAAGYAPHSIHNYWGPLHLVLAHAVRVGVIASNPAARLTSSERPKPGSGRRRFLGREEVERLLDAAPERYRLALACGLFSGLRLSELLGLTWEEIDFAGGTVRVRFQMGRDGKRRRLKTAAARREVILMSGLGAQLRRWRLASPFSRDDDLIFCATSGRTIGHRNLTARGLEKAAKRAEIGRVNFHALRHTFASILIAQGHDPVFVSRQLGHTNAAITLKVYVHLFDAERHAASARDRLDAEYGALLGGR